MTDTTTTHVPHDVTDLSLAAEGLRRIEWAEREMPTAAPDPDVDDAPDDPEPVSPLIR